MYIKSIEQSIWLEDFNLGKVDILVGDDLFVRQQKSPKEEDKIITAFRNGRVLLRELVRTEGFTNSEYELGYQHIDKGDLVIHGMDAFAGSMGISENTGKGSPILIILKSKNEKKYNLNYWKWFFRYFSYRNYFMYFAQGIRERTIDFKFSTLKKMVLPVFSYEQQTSIAKYLDHHTTKLDKEISLLEQKVEKLDEYKQALIYETVTKGLDKNVPMKDSGIEWIGMIPEHWEVKRVNRIVKSIQTGKEDASFADENGKYNYYTCSRDSFKCSTPKFKGTAILLAGNGDISNIKHIQNPNEKFNTYQRVYVLKKISSNERFIYYCFLSSFATSVKSDQKGSVIEFIKLKDIMNFKIPFCFNEQQQIAEFLDERCSKIDKKKELINKKVELLKEYKQSLIYEAVTGKINIGE